MSKHIKTGRLGEQLAVKFFEQLGYEILHSNWRCTHWEIDIIASKYDCLHFIEVKTKSSTKFGYPEEAVSKKKISVNLEVPSILLTASFNPIAVIQKLLLSLIILAFKACS